MNGILLDFYPLLTRKLKSPTLLLKDTGKPRGVRTVKALDSYCWRMIRRLTFGKYLCTVVDSTR